MRGESEVGLREAGAGFTKRVGCANMHHNGAARRRWSRAWSGAMRLQARCACARDARSKEVEQVFAFLTRGSASCIDRRHPLHPFGDMVDTFAKACGTPKGVQQCRGRSLQSWIIEWSS